ncbi:MAG: hypothetical protein H0Z24_06885 [Thermosipho sp. (in: Bacteria)]|nr:hypothetical protein [Thermosipho sp. (in: thermotogales)]
MYNFILTYYPDILTVCLFISILIFLYYRGKRDIVKKIILSLVVEAEKQLGSKTGELKYAFVVERLYPALPRVVKIFITRKQLDKMIEEAVAKLKEFLADENNNLLGYYQEYLLNANKAPYKP